MNWVGIAMTLGTVCLLDVGLNKRSHDDSSSSLYLAGAAFLIPLDWFVLILYTISLFKRDYPMKMKRFNKNLVVIAIEIMIAAFACVSMWGCSSWFEEETTMSVSKKRTGGYLTAFVNDSLAIVWNGRDWGTYNKSCDYYDSCEKGTLNQGVFLVNYREMRPPLWGDTVDGSINVVEGFYSDSSVMFFNDNEEFGFWKIGGNARIVRKWKWDDTCKWDGFRLRASAWIDGKVLMKGAFHCEFAILDTATGYVDNLEYTGDYAWLEGCDDITYIDDEVLCLKRLDDPMGSISLLNSEGVVDSLGNPENDNFIGYPPILYGNFILVQVYKKDRLVAKMGKDGFDDDYPETWMKYNSFVDSTGFSISYSSDDLVITK